MSDLQKASDLKRAIEAFGRAVNNERLLTMRRPPWTCTDCGQDTITIFEYQTEGINKGGFKATCTACGEVVYS